MFVNPRLSCESCIKPVARRLALFQAKDEYECYADGYVKCFWGLCDRHKSEEELVPKVVTKVVTEQPKSTNPFRNYITVQDLTLKEINFN